MMNKSLIIANLYTIFNTFCQRSSSIDNFQLLCDFHSSASLFRIIIRSYIHVSFWLTLCNLSKCQGLKIIEKIVLQRRSIRYHDQSVFLIIKWACSLLTRRLTNWINRLSFKQLELPHEIILHTVHIQYCYYYLHIGMDFQLMLLFLFSCRMKYHYYQVLLLMDDLMMLDDGADAWWCYTRHNHTWNKLLFDG